MASEGHGESVERWDPWAGWFLPFLWECVAILTINAPGEIFTEFLRATMSFLTAHEFEKAH